MVKADDLEQIGELGRGAYGVVDKMRHVPSGVIMAVKVSSCRPNASQIHVGNIAVIKCLNSTEMGKI